MKLIKLSHQLVINEHKKKGGASRCWYQVMRPGERAFTVRRAQSFSGQLPGIAYASGRFRGMSIRPAAVMVTRRSSMKWRHDRGSRRPRPNRQRAGDGRRTGLRTGAGAGRGGGPEFL
jgi:hypothetical protein